LTTKVLALSLAIVVLLNSIFAHSSGGKISENQKSFDVVFYDVDIKVDPYKKIISGEVVISFILYQKVKDIELDLINEYSISSAHINGTSITFKHKKNKIFVENPDLDLFKEQFLKIKYVGKPPVSKNPPWEGGIVWDKDKNGNHWIGISCQSSGAHIWFPCKKHPSDKANNGAKIKVTIPRPLKAISNGLLKKVTKEEGYWDTWHWETNYPISSYNINFTVGDFNIIKKTGYILDEPLPMFFYTFSEIERGLDLLERAEEYLSFYAENFGQYPWIKEKFGVVETPYWGMEHQTIIAYGNNHKKTDLGYDFLLFHEIGHEWWGNYLSVSDWSDFWIHEGINTYAEALYVEKKYDYKTANSFINKKFKSLIKNKKALIPEANEHIAFFEDNDVYYKSAYLLNSLRYLIGESVLRESLKEFLHMPKESEVNQTKTEEFISLIEENSKLELDWFFDYYFKNKNLPTLNVREKVVKEKKFIDLRWEEEGFKMPITINYISFDGLREKKVALNNTYKRIVIPKTSGLILDPNSVLLFKKNIYAVD
jgi:aminopeptidase N